MPPRRCAATRRLRTRRDLEDDDVKTARWIASLTGLCLVALALTSGASADGAEPLTVDRIAGQLEVICTVTFDDDVPNLTVTLDVTKPGWTLTVTHV